ncbi:hypothetical protein E2C01_074640 [Portunus trituberculatus]|uniref:Uncharacterized protein n=1 Tax=Portunus trituberculatus TaxID=210409 RepID=A0A5B7ID08_PORTR|nr:hypothetical protein [Portunus trituberculatus]
MSWRRGPAPPTILFPTPVYPAPLPRPLTLHPPCKPGGNRSRALKRPAAAAPITRAGGGLSPFSRRNHASRSTGGADEIAAAHPGDASWAAAG